MIIYGKRTRKPKPSDYPLNLWDKPEYGHGTKVTISLENDKYIYTIYDNSKGELAWFVASYQSPFYTSFNTLDEAKEHIINNFGGTWKWY